MSSTERELKVKSILITQPPPEAGKNVYEDFVKKYKLKMDFRSFIHIEPMAPRDIRKQKINFFGLHGHHFQFAQRRRLFLLVGQ